MRLKPNQLKVWHGEHPLLAAARSGNVDAIRLWVGSGVSVDLRNHLRSTPLMLATIGSHLAAITELGRLGADLTARDANGSTPLHYAALHGSQLSVDLLIAMGADRRVRNLSRLTSFDAAMSRRHLTVAESLRV